MDKAFQQVRDFHEKFGCAIGDKPGIPADPVKSLRTVLVMEEYRELLDAINTGDIVKVADAIADLTYVLIGMAITFGIPAPAVWDEIHAANMRKEGGGEREDGKILKPEGWEPPDVHSAVFGKER